MTTTSNKSPLFFASIKERYSLSKEGSKKSTFHIELDLKGSGIQYQVGDSLAIHPKNDPTIVQKSLDLLNASGEEIVVFRGVDYCLNEIFHSKANITQLNKKLLKFLHEKAPIALLEKLLKEENKEELKEFLNNNEPWQVLQLFGSTLSAQEFCDQLSPLLPRFYSIASSPCFAKEEIHLTVALVRYEQEQLIRNGVCSHFLCHIADKDADKIPVYIQSHNGFTLPQDPSVPIIMIGPGTGVAPFRAFMQARMKHDQSKDNWLFFGDWTEAHDFLYQDFWLELQERGKLRVTTAFSRDSDEKIYVQHQMMNHSQELFKWIESGGHIYVCGDASRMAKDVDASLHQIIAKEGNLDEAATKAYMKQLRSEKRYLRDVY